MIQHRTPQLTINSVTFTFIFHSCIKAAIPISGETGEQFRAAGSGICQCGIHFLGQPVVLHQLSVDSPPCHLVFHQTSLHHSAQLLLLRDLTLQALHLLTALHGQRE